MSFDVTSLFTNVPVDLVIDDIANKLFSYEVASKLPFLQAKKPITQNIFKKLLKLSTEGMFIHNGKLFSQIDGVAMGNPLGPTLANWFLGMIEKKKFLINIFRFFHHFMYVTWTMCLPSSIPQLKFKCS